MEYGKTAKTRRERETTRSIAAGKGGKGTRRGLGDMDAGAARTGCDADTTTALQRRTRQHVGSVGGFVRLLEGRLQHISGQGEGGQKERLADMWRHVSRGARADRQGMQLVEGDTIGGSMDGVSLLLGTTSDIPFVGSRTRTWADRI
jgi:hypothetical protein